jgi:hypothetical protein
MNRLRLLAIFLICILASTYILLRMLYCIFRNPQKAWIQAITIDRSMNVAANGDPDETISSRANRSRKEEGKWGCRLCRILDWLDPDHCNSSAGT